MIDQTKSPYNWQCIYCKRTHKGKDGYYRLSCLQDKLDVCRDCAKSIQYTDQLFYQFPVQCGICQQQLQNATRWCQNWQCHKCNVNYKATKTKGRLICTNHNLNYCYDCIKTEKEKFIHLDDGHKQKSILQNLKDFFGTTDKIPDNYHNKNHGIFMIFPNKEHCDILKYQRLANQNINQNINYNQNQLPGNQNYNNHQNQNQNFNNGYNQNQNLYNNNKNNFNTNTGQKGNYPQFDDAYYQQHRNF
ncbi:hypothetical protein PPERSA_12451 [Pseudocohnilembus persalinus]|uniref:Uncharacterized protein n=1 Tax=Pseudocohnilembus persalinus TaxID=266149 RepID=A0A0V0QPC7_PSEPJ|nr:hypothetical protein PPERSA_12451 [Pseudocohnilembus persalinus]|eukprot:KRX04004.1 hypothetical protein PPERSA_12451 [Pseudocohnilembus persalinus]